MVISMAQCKTAVTPLLTHWSYCSLTLSHWYISGSRQNFQMAMHCGNNRFPSNLNSEYWMTTKNKLTSTRYLSIPNKTDWQTETTKKTGQVTKRTNFANTKLISGSDFYLTWMMCIDQCQESKYKRHVTLVAVTGIIILMPYLYIKSLQSSEDQALIWNMPDLQMSCRDLTRW